MTPEIKKKNKFCYPIFLQGRHSIMAKHMALQKCLPPVPILAARSCYG